MNKNMTFAERVTSFFKSLGDPGEENKNEGGEEAASTQSEQGAGGEGGGEQMEKSNLIEATDLLNALVDELRTMNKSLDALSKRQDGIEKAYNDIGDAVVGVAELVSKIANSPMPLKTTMAKGGLGNGTGTTSEQPQTALTLPEFEEKQRALQKAFNEKRISLFESSRLEGEMQKAMQVPGYRMRPQDYALIKELKTA
jgi:archaellum component FlaC